MALRAATDAPEITGQLIAEQLPLQQLEFSANILLRKIKPPLQVSAPHAVYTVGARNARDGKVLSAAQHSGWRCIVFDGESETFSGEVDRLGEGEELPRFSHLTSGPSVWGTVDILLSAEARPDIVQGDFELRYLKVSGLYVASLWLYDRSSSGADLIVPLQPAPPPLEPGRFYRIRDFVEAVRVIAVRRLEFGEDEEP